MVKGVNKTVIEVNDTGNRMFEKIVFYVTPQYGNIDPKRLQRAAGEFTLKLSKNEVGLPLRESYRKNRRKKQMIAVELISVVAIFSVLALIL